MVKFGHIADIHLGSWNDPKMTELNDRTFCKAIDICIQERVDFVIIAGDIYNTSFPGVDRIKTTIEKFRQLQKQGIRLYYIAGSHDYSPSGKTMLDIIEKAGLGTNVSKGTVNDNGELTLKFTTDLQTGVKITGVVGKKGMLDKKYYDVLDRQSLEKEEGFKIFCLHTALTELKPQGYEEMDSAPISLLPKGFNYYAAGHVHVNQVKEIPEYGKIVYPGPLFPNNFKELEAGMGGFYIYDNGELNFRLISLAEIVALHFDCEDKIPEQVTTEIFEKLEGRRLSNTIVLLRFSGQLIKGKASDIPFREIFHRLYQDYNALIVMKNVSKLISRDYEEVKVRHSSIDELESTLIMQHMGQLQYKDIPEKDIINSLMKVLCTEKEEGEVSKGYEDRLKQEVDNILKLN